MAEKMYGGLFILGFVAFAMILYGIGQIWSDTPVNFYNLEAPPEIKDKEVMHKWNKIHGWMWVIYGFFFVILAIIYSQPFSEGLLQIFSVVLVIVPLPVMIIIHTYTKKKLLK